MINQAVLEVCDRNLFDLARDRAVQDYGPLDTFMGISGKDGLCRTCGENLQQCNGHFGHIKLALPAFHIGYLKLVIFILQCICKVDCHIEYKIMSHVHRAAQGFCFLKIYADPSYETSAGPISIISNEVRFVRKLTQSAGRLVSATTVESSMGRSRKLANTL